MFPLHLILFFFNFILKIESTHYETLKVDKYATKNEIEKAYNKMKVENRNAKISDKEFLKNMKKLSDAHYVLSDKKKRQEYDMELKGKSNLENKRKSAEGESSNRDDQKDEESLGSPQSFRSSHFMGGSGSFFGKGFPFGGTSGKGVTIGGNTHYGTGIQKVGPTDVVGGIPTSGTKITIGGNINSRGS